MDHQRTILCKQRRNLNSSERQLVAEKNRQYLLASRVYHQSQHIAIYMAHQGEVETEAIIQSIWQDNKNCYLPILHQQNHGHMYFAAYTADTELKNNRFNIPEPVNSQPYPTQNLDLVLLPLVAFDSHGNRLGMGKGYYDRTFQFMLASPTPSKPLLIGLAYHFQQVEPWQPNAWDVPLAGVVTELGFHIFQTPIANNEI